MASVWGGLKSGQVFLVLSMTVAAAAIEPVDTSFIYDCLLCQHAVDKSLKNERYRMLPLELMQSMSNGTSVRAACEVAGACAALAAEGWRGPRGGGGDAIHDIRISKAYGSRGYDKVRVSVISDGPVSSDIFSYSEPFKYRWTDNVLNTGILTVTPGEVTTIVIEGQSYEILIPREDSPVRGVVMADPCFSNEFVWCSYGDDFDTFNRSTMLLNAINSHDDTDFWMILGDNFYDQSGAPTKEWFRALSKESKTKVFGSVPGNHDFWIFSSPRVVVPNDQLGNGFMQYYGQDVAASASSGDVLATPYDFSVNPDLAGSRPDGESIPPASDFFWYYKIGNVGVISYSGGHSYDEMLPFFDESCRYMASSSPAAVLLLGHWNTPGLGCPQDMFVPATYRRILEVESCAGLAPKLRYLMGHEHCNKVVELDVGFMVAGQGMTASLPCGGNYGLPVIDTYDDKFSVYFFDIAQLDEYDHFDDIFNCISENGLSGCYHLASVWSSVPLVK